MFKSNGLTRLALGKPRLQQMAHQISWSLKWSHTTCPIPHILCVHRLKHIYERTILYNSGHNTIGHDPTERGGIHSLCFEDENLAGLGPILKVVISNQVHWSLRIDQSDPDTDHRSFCVLNCCSMVKIDQFCLKIYFKYIKECENSLFNSFERSFKYVNQKSYPCQPEYMPQMIFDQTADPFLMWSPIQQIDHNEKRSSRSVVV